MKILVIGGGNMGLTYAQSLVRSHITNKESLMILVRTEEKLAELEARNIGQIFIDPALCVAQADLVILAVKPQDSGVLFAQIKNYLQPQQLILSIMAGIQINSIYNVLNVSKIVRAMPNLPSQIGMGMTVFTSTDEVTRLELVMVQNLLSTTGKTIYVEKELSIDAATAISGSGPAYVYYMMDAMMRAAKDMGFSESESETLIVQTFNGALDLYNKSDLTCQDWIKKVSSKGGTTEAAIKSFNENRLDQDLIDGVNAAYLRAQALGKVSS